MPAAETPLPYSRRRLTVALLDLVIVIGMLAAAFLLRFEFSVSDPHIALFPAAAPAVAVSYFACFYVFGLYRGIYYYSSFSDLLNITKGVALAGLVTAAWILFARQGQFPRSILLLHPILAFLGVGAVRFGIRLGKTWLNMPRAYTGRERNVLLVGAGELGESLLRQIQKTPELNYRVVGFIDDDPAKWGMRVHGVPVYGGCSALRFVLGQKHVDEIVISVAARRGQLVAAVMEKLRGLERRPELKIAPSLDEMLRSPTQGMSLRKVKPADLLNRGVVHLDKARIGRFLEGKTVLVTGAGGTIGSELCRQAAQYGPARLVLLESHATSLFYADSALRKEGGPEIVPVLGDVRDQACVGRLFEEHGPQVVLHAAAHKHVHQIEENVAEGISNNVLGTYYLARAARKHGAEAFLLVSTDKAVRPRSVMGATKRVAELLVRGMARQGGTRFMAVRFGNVLGSSGSVLEIFQRQIAQGGPITLTHPDVTRYFMTVEESVELILQAAAMAKGGEVFVLKMGTPVKILDMARNLLLLSGLEPGKDIEIRVVGLKRGEKLDEELVEEPADCSDSEHPSIMVLRKDELPDIEARVLDLELAVRAAPPSGLVERLKELVPTFAPDAIHAAR